jgi:hypothetical protein
LISLDSNDENRVPYSPNIPAVFIKES